MEQMSDGVGYPIEPARWSSHEEHGGLDQSPVHRRSFGTPRSSRPLRDPYHGSAPDQHEEEDYQRHYHHPYDRDSLASPPPPRYPPTVRSDGMERVPSSFSVVRPPYSYEPQDGPTRRPQPYDSGYYPPESPNPASERGRRSGDASVSSEEEARYQQQYPTRRGGYRGGYDPQEDCDLAQAFHKSVRVEERPQARSRRMEGEPQRRRYEEERRYEDHRGGSRQHAPPSRRGDSYEQEDHHRHPSEPESTVDWVHHDSPVGPAVSVYPKGYDWRSNSSSSEDGPRGDDYYYEEPRSQRGPGCYYERGPPGQSARAKLDEMEQRHHSSSRSNTRNSHDGSSRVRESKNTLVEISPGVQVKLRGAAETKECVRRDFFLPTKCFSCDLEMFCIQDAAYVLCPQCRVVNPLTEVDEGQEGCEGGLGLGFTMDDLALMQQEELAK
mmetsp:Transcript_30550/g.63791  ORF Transcript_30550/g.63791 Transcript_30550/m.63791 type:complete len:439 (-) Transcript_30550:400-1716(-)|eukprot:CAMPEP_0172471060 /NCGR_PEP_ID=MMETSP1065-20121228/67622_1 /TAXON_ID=265537 /ORGANISM="Amphiprora paludosa, Strain CCMP125" /LENGTH=438 /DNA_ID=CAMNT_0013229147 /DNA_START=611 /DNA_END=1927 /DNA_ORIENTATION=-